MAAARRDVGAYAPRTVAQRDLVGLLRAMLDYIETNHCIPGQSAQFDRWWKVLSAFRRALDFPEMAGPRSREAFKKLVRMEVDDLFAVARKGWMGSRMPNRKPGKSREEERRRSCVER